MFTDRCFPCRLPGWVLVLLLNPVYGETASARPNVVILLADDMGYGDVQALAPESQIPTPNLNRLAAQGMRFTDAHTPSSVCTPTRYGLLTGRYCWRTRLKSGVLFPPGDAPLIDADRITIAGLLKEADYRTACIGKWHLGIDWARDEEGKVDFNQPIRFGPTDVGFDVFYGVAASLDMIPYGFYSHRAPVEAFTETQPAQGFPRYVRKGPKTASFDPGAALDRLLGEACTFIRTEAATPTPFFLYFPFTAPHKPVWPAPRFVGTTELGPYGDFVHQVDWVVGQVLDTLEEVGATEDTLVIFTSDNGSFMYRLGDAAPDHVEDPTVQAYRPEHHRANAHWRGTKADIWEAGHRVPFIVRWPGQVAPGTEDDHTVCLTDVMATLAEVVGRELPTETAEDSYSFLSLLTGQPDRFDRPPVIHHSANGVFAIREGAWKLVLGNGSGGREKPVGKPFEAPFSLFDLAADPGETRNVATEHPELVDRLSRTVEEFRTSGRSVNQVASRPR